MFWSKLCESNWISAWNLAFPVFISPIVWNMCENLDCGATQRPRLLLTDNIQSRGCTSITNPNPITSKCHNNNVILIPCGCGWLHQRTQIIMLVGWGHTKAFDQWWKSMISTPWTCITDLLLLKNSFFHWSTEVPKVLVNLSVQTPIDR